MRITYQVESAAGTEHRELPFVVGVLGDFVGHHPEPLPRLRDRRFLNVDADTIDSVLNAIQPGLLFSVDNMLAEDPDAARLRVSLSFRSLRDFEPQSVASQLTPTRRLLDLRRQIYDLLASVSTDPSLDAAVYRCLTDSKFLHAYGEAEQSDLHDSGTAATQLLTEFMSANGWAHSCWKEWEVEATLHALRSIVEFVGQNPTVYSRSCVAMLRAALSQADGLITRQVDAIIHHPEFQTLEAAWRGLNYLCARCGHSQKVRIRVLNVTKRELLKDLQKASEFDQSGLHRHVYSEFATLGGEPFSLLVGAYGFACEPEEVECLEKIAEVAADAHCPFIAAAQPAMLQMDSFRDLDAPRSLVPIFGATRYAKWSSFRRYGDSWYAGLVMPGILLRRPYELKGEPTLLEPSFEYTERIASPADLLWGNAAFALAANLAVTFVDEDAPAAFGGPGSGGLVEDLPLWSTVTDDGGKMDLATEIGITDQRQAELSDLGFISLCHRKGTTEAVFFDLPSCHLYATQTRNHLQPRTVTGYLDSVLVASRFAHYLKCIMRDKVGTYSKVSQWQSYLHSWLGQYISTSAEGDDHKPLIAGGIQFEQTWYRSPRLIATLKPNFRNRIDSPTLRVLVSLPQVRDLRE